MNKIDFDSEVRTDNLKSLETRDEKVEKAEPEAEAWDIIMNSTVPIRKSNRRRARNNLNNEDWDESEDKIKRWGQDQDKHLFKVIRELQAQGKFNLEEVLKMNPARDANSHPSVRLLSDILNWKTVRKALVRRIQTLYNKQYSVREVKRLKRKLKNLKQTDQLDFEALIYEFPGKSMESLKRLSEDLMKRISDKTLSRFNIDEYCG